MSKTTYDPEVEALYIYTSFGEKYHGKVVTFVLLNDEVMVNFDRTADGRLVGIELLGVGKLEVL